MKEDEFSHAFFRLLNFFRKYRRELIVGLITVLLIIIGFSGFTLWKEYSLSNNNKLLGKYLNSDKLDVSKLPGKWKPLYYIESASRLIENGKLSEAERELQTMPKKKGDFFYYKYLLLCGEINFQRKDFNKALQYFKEIENDKPENFPWEIALIKIGDCYWKMNKPDQAKYYYNRVTIDFPDSYFSIDAQNKLNKLQ